jgi:NAD(P)-dependent dehydrogenase (short-subunit alcohol dehydrogenase family)
MTGFLYHSDEFDEHASFSARFPHKLAASAASMGAGMRLKGKIAIVVGAGQSPGEGMGNGRATVLRFVEEGAKVLAVDSNVSSAAETASMAGAKGNGECIAFEADVCKESTLAAMADAAAKRWGRIDILHYNVGVSIAGGDAPLDVITEAAFDRIATVNLRGAIMACKHVLPVMRAQGSGVVVMISSVAAWEQYPNVAYKATKAGMIAFTQQLAIQNAQFGIRANVILPGLMDTPMAVDTRARVSGKSRAEVAAARDARVPLRHKMGTAWDVANAALFLASDEANFITGIALPVDGGALVHIN